MWVANGSPSVFRSYWLRALLLFASLSPLLQYILDEKAGLNFQYPVFLTTFHMAFATVGTRVLARTTHLLDGLKTVEVTPERWYRNILPIGALFSASLVTSNAAYLTLSVSFIQMLKVRGSCRCRSDSGCVLMCRCSGRLAHVGTLCLSPPYRPSCLSQSCSSRLRSA